MGTPGEETRTERAVQQVRRILQERFAQDLPLDELAREVGLSKYHLAREFRRRVGRSPHAFLIERRLEGARELLRRGVSNAEAAARSGFSDQSHLHRAMRKRWGSSPSEFRPG
jgi:AraC-like DNA-binding protein